MSETALPPPSDWESLRAAAYSTLSADLQEGSDLDDRITIPIISISISVSIINQGT